jgi:hypothetical protein
VDEFPRHDGRSILPVPLAVTHLIASGTLDAELAALLWLLIEGRVPLLVAAGPQGAGKSTLLHALLVFQRPTEQQWVLRGFGEDFDWLPQAPELGWPQKGSAGRPELATRRVSAAQGSTGAGTSRRDRPDPGATTLLVHEFSPHLPAYTWDIQARVAVRALQLGFSLAGTLHAESLREVIATLEAPPVTLDEDEIRRLGVVLILRAFGRPPVRRIVAAHYLRPLERDGQGHLQRRPPAVLATWDPERDTHDHFSWGLGPEIAPRVGMTQADFERAQAARARFLTGLVAAGTLDPGAVRAATDDYLQSHPPQPASASPTAAPPTQSPPTQSQAHHQRANQEPT